MYKAYKFRLYPNEEQIIYINKNFGCGRLVYNHYLNDIKENGYKNAYTCIKDYTSVLKYEKPFLQEADSIMIRNELFFLEDSLKRFYNSGYGYPKFKSKFDKNSYTTDARHQDYNDKHYCNIEVDLEKKEIKLPKLKWVKIRGYRNLNSVSGKIISTTISREPNGKYYVSVIYKQDDIKEEFIIPNTIVGIDLGIKKLLTLSDGTIFENNKYIEKYEKRIKRCQKELSRKKKGSNNYYKCKKRLATLYSKLKNARKYYIHKITKKITDNYDVIVCEKLQTKEMVMKKELSKKLTDASFYEIIRQLEYKSKFKGKQFYQIDTYFPSSQTCSVCGKIDKKYKDLKERNYICTNCHNELDRDVNASVNIMFEGLKLFMNKNYNLI